MSEEPIDLYYHDRFHEDQHTAATTGFSFSPSNSYNLYDQNPNYISNISPTHPLLGFDHSYMKINESIDYSTLARDLDLSPSLSEALFVAEDEQKTAMAAGDLVAGGETPVTPNSSMSTSSNEAGGGDNDINQSKNEEEPKGLEDGREISKKVNKEKKKGAKKEKEQRFAFMTKSEVDHLEDGYRWRKYGQKAVKNSPYPRSYYRCTTQKCTVKKRVERSFQDPSIVVTTYEGQHNHLIPANHRGNVNATAGMYSQSMLPPMGSSSSSSFYDYHQERLRLQFMPQALYNYGSADYGLLQDMVPSMFMNHHP